MATEEVGKSHALAPVSPNQHRWINTVLAVVAGITAVLTAFHEHQVVKLDVVPCVRQVEPGTVPTAELGVRAR